MAMQEEEEEDGSPEDAFACCALKYAASGGVYGLLGANVCHSGAGCSLGSAGVVCVCEYIALPWLGDGLRSALFRRGLGALGESVDVLTFHRCCCCCCCC